MAARLQIGIPSLLALAVGSAGANAGISYSQDLRRVFAKGEVAMDTRSDSGSQKFSASDAGFAFAAWDQVASGSADITDVDALASASQASDMSSSEIWGSGESSILVSLPGGGVFADAQAISTLTVRFDLDANTTFRAIGELAAIGSAWSMYEVSSDDLGSIFQRRVEEGSLGFEETLELGSGSYTLTLISSGHYRQHPGDDGPSEQVSGAASFEGGLRVIPAPGVCSIALTAGIVGFARSRRRPERRRLPAGPLPREL